MKALGILFRLVCSLVLLAVAAIYVNAPADAPSGILLQADSWQSVAALCTSCNWFTLTAILLIVLAFVRVLNAAWNILFCGAILVLLSSGITLLIGVPYSVPGVLRDNALVLEWLQMPLSYPIAIAITLFIFATGWLCATASLRVAITAGVSYLLWYGCTELLSYATTLWAESADPAMPETLHMIQAAPWIIAAVPGAFFLIYAVLMSFFETFITSGSKTSVPKKATPAPTAEEKKESESAPAPAPAAEEKKPEEPKAKTTPLANSPGKKPRIIPAGDSVAKPESPAAKSAHEAPKVPPMPIPPAPSAAPEEPKTDAAKPAQEEPAKDTPQAEKTEESTPTPKPEEKAESTPEQAETPAEQPQKEEKP